MEEMVVVINDSERLKRIPFGMVEGENGRPEYLFQDFRPGANTLDIETWGKIKDYHKNAKRKINKKTVTGVDVEQHYGLEAMETKATKNGQVDVSEIHHMALKKIIDNCFDVETLKDYEKQESKGKARPTVLSYLSLQIEKCESMDQKLKDVAEGREKGRAINSVLGDE